ncbi:MAG: sigma-70 family RNA polymerase sigma factor [Isosphaeraceae bacterium]
MDDRPITRPSLLIRLRDPGDERAWEEFIEIYTPLIHRLARQRGFQDADADDLTQEVFRAVAGAIDRWDPDPARGSFRAWLFRIAQNLMINFLASARRRPQTLGDSGVKDLLDARVKPTPDDSSQFGLEYRRRLFQWAAEKVRGEFREPTWQAFWMTAVDGKKAKEAANALGLSEGAVFMARSRVLARVRRTIEQVEDD